MRSGGLWLKSPLSLEGRVAGKLKRLFPVWPADIRMAGSGTCCFWPPPCGTATSCVRRLVAKCGVAMGLGVESLSQFSRRLAASRAVLSRVAARSVADELLIRVIRREVESGGASYFRPILRTRGLGRLVRAAILNLVSERTDASRISRWGRGVQGCRSSKPWRPSIPPMARSLNRRELDSSCG